MKYPRSKHALALVGLSFVSMLSSCEGGGSNAIAALIPGVGPGSFGAFAFSLRQDVDLGAKGLSGAVFQDLNNDGLVDFAELSRSANRLHIGRGLPDGTFVEVGVLTTPTAPWSISQGDYDGDGRVDLAVGCLPSSGSSGGSGVLALYLQDGLGDFALTATTPLLGLPYSMTRLWEGGSDLDAVGSDDLLVALWEADMVQQLRWNGAAWTLMTQLAGPSGGLSTASPLTVATIDMDGDGDLDVVVGEVNVKLSPDRVVAYANDGMGGFMPAQMVLPAVNTPIIRNQGDVDGDGFEDLSIDELGGSGVLLLHGSAGGLLAIDTVDFGGRVSGSVWRDFDSDGLIDVATARVFDQAIGVRFGAPAGALPGLVFEDPTFYNVGWTPHDLTAVVMPQDGFVDLICANIDDVSVLHNLGDRNFLGARGYEVSDDPVRVVTTDLNGDGKVDVLCLDQFQKQILVMEGQGDGSFVKAAQIPLALTDVATPGHMVVRDFDEDGLNDILVTVFEAGDMRLLRNPGSLNFTAPAVSDKTSIGTEPLGIDAADFNDDGHWDVVVANSMDQNIQVLLGDGTGAFTAQSVIPAGGKTKAVYAGDLNGDGFADAVVTMVDLDEKNARLKLYSGDGTGTLVEMATFPLAVLSVTIETGDLNDDGLVDLVFGQSTALSDTVSILMNQGGFGFSLSTLKVGDHPGSLSIADVDADGDLDLVIPIGVGELRLALGDGLGGFPDIVPLAGAEFTMPVPFGTNSSGFADTNADGMADLLMVSPDTAFLWVALNLGEGDLN